MIEKMPFIRRLHWGCGDVRPDSWINSDLRKGPGIDISCDIVEGLPLADNSIDYISSQHALQQLKVYDIWTALRELYRVLKQSGVLRLCLPDLDKALDAYKSGQNDYFWCWDWETISGNFITQIMDFQYTRTPLNYEFTEELLQKSGFKMILRLEYRITKSSYPDIIELDSRPEESFYIEAFK